MHREDKALMVTANGEQVRKVMTEHGPKGSGTTGAEMVWEKKSGNRQNLKTEVGAGEDDFQLYKIHKLVKYKDITEKQLTLSQTPNSKQNQNGLWQTILEI